MKKTLLSGVVASAVPVPASIWLFGSGLLGLIGIAKRKKA
ncbi:VPLPA-CTERM sorting domain-containing protein [Pseudomonadota bacterium]